MTLKIWDESSINNTDDKQLYLRLVNLDGDDDIMLVAVDKTGQRINRGIIMGVSLDMRAFIFSSNISDDIPLRTDIEGHALSITQSRLAEIAEKEKRTRIDMLFSQLGERISSMENDDKEQTQSH